MSSSSSTPLWAQDLEAGGGSGQARCFKCKKIRPDTEIHLCRVAPFRYEHVCSACKTKYDLITFEEAQQPQF